MSGSPDDRAAAPDESTLVSMGYIAGAFGVRGWVKIHADTEYADSLFDYPRWWVGRPGGAWRAYTLEDGSVHSKGVAAKLEGVLDRDQAALMRGLTIAIERAELPPPEEGEYYWTDLIGLSVVNTQGETLGVVSELLATGAANDVLVVRQDKTERLIPFVGAYVLEVDLPGKTIRVDWGWTTDDADRRRHPVPGDVQRADRQRRHPTRAGARHLGAAHPLPRDFAYDNYRTVDDRPYGGGPGMVMRAEPLEAAIIAARQRQAEAGVADSHCIYLSPQGRPLATPACANWRNALA